jgi:hypothetical protein
MMGNTMGDSTTMMCDTLKKLGVSDALVEQVRTELMAKKPEGMKDEMKPEGTKVEGAKVEVEVAGKDINKAMEQMKPAIEKLYQMTQSRQ